MQKIKKKLMSQFWDPMLRMNEQTDEQGQIHKIVPLARVSENKFTYVTRDQLFVLRNFSEKKPRQLVPVAHTYQSSFHWKVSSVLLSRVLVYVPIKNLRTLDFVQRLHEHKSFRSRLSLWHHRLFQCLSKWGWLCGHHIQSSPVL